MRRASRVDANQPDVVAALRAIGASVQHLHAVGDGCPDLLVGFRGVNLLLEVKMQDKKLNDPEKEWHFAWRGQCRIAYSPEHAVELVQALTTR